MRVGLGQKMKILEFDGVHLMFVALCQIEET